MNIEKDFKLILLQYKLGDIILKEALEQVMDIYESNKQSECDQCGNKSKAGEHWFLCYQCVEKNESELEAQFKDEI